MGSFCAFADSVAPGCTGLHHVAPRCTTLHGLRVVKEHSLAASRVDTCWSATPQAGRRAKTCAPSTTPQSCAMWTTIAHDRAENPRKTHQKIPDSHNSSCAR